MWDKIRVMIIFVKIYTMLYIIGNHVYKLVYMVFENEYKYWKFTNIDYSKWYVIMSFGCINIEKCEFEQALKKTNDIIKS